MPDFLDDLDARRNDVLKDDLLRLMFTACHPVLSLDARLALTLKLLGGLATGEIARAFLVPESTMAQRIVRAKRTLGEAKVPFELPPPAELAPTCGANGVLGELPGTMGLLQATEVVKLVAGIGEPLIGQGLHQPRPVPCRTPHPC